MAVMAAGATFTSVVQSPTSAAVELHEVFVWYERDEQVLGSLYWCDVGTKTRLPEQRLPLNHVSDVFVGRSEREVQLPDNAPLCYFSLVSRNRSLRLIAPSAAVRATWLAGIQQVLCDSAKPIVQHPFSGQPLSSQSAAPTAMPSASVPAVSTPTFPRQHTSIWSSLFSRFHRPTRLEGMGPPPESLWSMEVHVTLTLDQGVAPSEARMYHRQQDGKLGAVHWSETEAKKPSLSPSLPIDLITDVVVGNSPNRLQRKDAHLLYPSQRCLSLLDQRERQYHVVFPSDESRMEWLKALREVLQGRKRVEDCLVQPQQSSHPSSDVVHIVGDPQAGLRCMLLDSQRGATRVVDLRWSSDSDSTAAAAGALYWSDVSGHIGADKSFLPLQALRAVDSEKQHARMQQPDSVGYPVDQCLSLLSTTGDVHFVFFVPAHREQCIRLLQSKWPRPGGATAPAAARSSVQPLHESFAR